MSAKADRTRQELAAQRDRVAASRARLAGLVAHGRAAASEATAQATGTVTATDAELAAWLAAQPVAEAHGFADQVAWSQAAAAPSTEPDWAWLRVGEHVERATGVPLGLPDKVPFVGSERPIVITSHGPEQFERGASLLQALTLRVAVMFGPQARFVLIDPGGAGRAFPLSRSLPGVVPATNDPRRDLEAVQDDIRRIIADNLGAEAASFEELPATTRVDLGFRFVFAADYPNRYDIRTVEALHAVAETGGPAGVYVIAHHNMDHEVTGDPQRYFFKRPVVVDVGTRNGTLSTGVDTVVRLDEAPSAGFQQLVLKAAEGASKSEDRVLPWTELHPADPASWWQETTERSARSVIGLGGSGREPLEVLFGVDDDDIPVVHGALGGGTGAGKSSLFHNLIFGLATRYGPDELRLSLVDMKQGVEFRAYQDLPHADVVCLQAAPELARSVLRSQVDEMQRRNGLFQRHGVSDLASYRQAGEPEGRLPRSLLVVDEYQKLFEDDRDNEASALLRALAQQGRSAGIHFLIAAQDLNASGMTDRAATFANIHLRMALRMNPDAVQSSLDFLAKGKELILKTCTAPGRVVMNSRGGQDDANLAGRVAYLDGDTYPQVAAALRAKADAAGDSRRPVVINGTASPPLLANPVVRALLARPTWPAPTDVEALCRAAPRDGGLGLAEFPVGERPLLCLLGQQFNVHGVATAVLRRRMGENLAVVGANGAARIGMLASAVAGLALTEVPGQLELAVVDRTPPGSAGAGLLTENVPYLLSLARFAHRVPSATDEVLAAVAELAAEVRRRQALGDAERAALPSRVLVANELDRIDPLCRIADDYGSSDSPDGALLTEVATAGPAVGVHLLAGFASVTALQRVFSDLTLKQGFRHAAALQMSADDSYTFIQSSGASKLQSDGPLPVVALVCDRQEQREVRAKPYNADPGPDQPVLADEVNTVAQHLYHRWPAEG